MARKTPVFVPASTVTATDVLSLSDAKTWLRVDSTAEDALITSLIGVCVEQVQNYTGVYLQQVTGTFYLTDFYDTYLPAGPLVSISDVTYPTAQEFTEYYAETKGVSPYIHFDQPPTFDTEIVLPVEIACTVGYSTPPAPLVHAVRLLLSRYYDQREDSIVGTVVAQPLPEGLHALLSPYRNVFFV